MRQFNVHSKAYRSQRGQSQLIEIKKAKVIRTETIKTGEQNKTYKRKCGNCERVR